MIIVIVIVIVFEIVFFGLKLFMSPESGVLITLVKYLKGHKSLGSLCLFLEWSLSQSPIELSFYSVRTATS